MGGFPSEDAVEVRSTVSVDETVCDYLSARSLLLILDACEHLTFYPRRSFEIVTYDYVGGMMAFGETFDSRIGVWVEQNIAQVAPEEIDGSGADALAAQLVIEAAIESWQTGTVVDL